jgi:hypothetical protein
VGQGRNELSDGRLIAPAHRDLHSREMMFIQ